MKMIAKSVLSLAMSVGLSTVALAQSAPSETQKAQNVSESHAKPKVTTPATPAVPATPAAPSKPVVPSTKVEKATPTPADSNKPLQPLAAPKSQAKPSTHVTQPAKPVVKNETGSQSGDMQNPSVAKPVK